MTRHRAIQPGPRRMLARASLSLVVVAALLLGACKGDLFIPNFNSPNVEDLEGDPSPQQIASAATGIIVSTRVDWADYALDLGVLGREALDLDEADPRFVTELLQQPFDPGSRAFGGDHWFEPYAAIRSVSILLNALDTATLVTEPQKEALRGFAKTMEALNLLVVITTHDANGAPVDVNLAIGDFGPIVSKDAVFDRIESLLDEAVGNLQNGGDAFPFRLPSGFAGFDTPGSFIPFNRALRARVDVLRSDFTSALTHLSESFLTDCGAFDTGVYFNYSTASGDVANQIFQDPSNPNIRAHPSLATLAQLQSSGDPDQRFLDKVVTTDPKTLTGHTSDLAFIRYSGPTAPIPIIRNEELILLRAEANIGLGNISAAADDINCIRTTVGGLPPRADLNASNALDELLYNKLFSLLFEGGFHWLDLRHYGKLGELPLDTPLDIVHDIYPIPTDETLARQ